MSFKIPKYIEPDFNLEKFIKAPDVVLVEAPRDKAAPDNYHAMSIYPEYFKINGEWVFAEESRMDTVAVWDGEKIHTLEFRNLHKGDKVVVGRSENAEEGIYVHFNAWDEEEQEEGDLFAFRQGRSRETGFTYDYEGLIELLKHERDNGGYVVWVMGPACSFDYQSRIAFGKLVEDGYCQALLAGNALATHDLEGAYLGTALGSDIVTQMPHKLGHYNHLDLINKVCQYGSIKDFIEGEKIKNGIIYSCVKADVPFVLTGSIRDDGPLPEVFGNAYEGANEMRKHVRKATTVIGMATMLHTIATGNMTPSFRVLEDGTVRPVYFYAVDASEFVVNKLSDRGSLSAKAMVTNVQDFVKYLSKELCE
ncbi:MAG: hypothetical protein MJ145_01270 [Clostridia bacterium]|nr:hypothetical protein [Clostridia bacterium]